MGTPAVLIRKSTGEIIKHADYPREDMQPIAGLDSDLEWLVEYIPYVQPDYDSRIFVLLTTESVTTKPHPEWNWLNQYQITYSTVKRPESEITEAIVNAETDANSKIFSYTKQLFIIFVIGIWY